MEGQYHTARYLEQLRCIDLRRTTERETTRSSSKVIGETVLQYEEMQKMGSDQRFPGFFVFEALLLDQLEKRLHSLQCIFVPLLLSSLLITLPCLDLQIV